MGALGHQKLVGVQLFGGRNFASLNENLWWDFCWKEWETFESLDQTLLLSVHSLLKLVSPANIYEICFFGGSVGTKTHGISGAFKFDHLSLELSFLFPCLVKMDT